MRQADDSHADGSSSVHTAGARPSNDGDAALAATRELRRWRMPRMPTELVLTTRMPPVRHVSKPGSGVRPLSDSTPEFDRRPTAPFQRLPEHETRGYAADSVIARAVLRARAPHAHSESQHADNAHHATEAADYSVPAVSSERDAQAMAMAMAATDHHVVRRQRAAASSERDAQATAAAVYAVAAYHEASQRIPTPRRPAPVPQHVATAYHDVSQRIATPPRQIPVPHREAHHASLTRVPQPRRDHAGHSSSAAAIPGESLAHLHQQLAAAMDTARRSEQRAMEAELRASWAERFVPQTQDHELERLALRRHHRMRWLKLVLQISFVGLAVGGYASLLLPVRERVIAQNAVIEKLTTVQRQLRDEKRELLERIENLNPPSDEPAGK